ncbi:scavenger receptor class B member 1 [Ixodes scapularis]|uniref:scavenger receptor class B member 1 n=1 Tax=Ixodes scapularis TaxID=6945 RepID=UPI001A9EA265|nr:scavenger receptor class B member 1 [Ixodes scapularis]
MTYCRALAVVAVVGFLLMILGGAGVLFVPKLFVSIVLKKLPLVNGSEAFELWRDIPLPAFQRVYFFNLTNPYEFLQEGKKPKLQEVGPYTFGVSMVKTNIVWNSNGTVSYREVRTFHFDREKSVGGQDDVIVSINAPLVGAGALLKRANPALRLVMAVVINKLNEQLIVNHTVGELLYDGYPDFLAAASHMLDPTIPTSDGKFGYMHGRNATDDGLYTVYTGEDQMDLYNIITRWNGKENLTAWKGTCNMINGTNGELEPPLKPGQDTLELFNSDICRSLKLVREGTDSLYGISAVRFRVDNRTFDNGTAYPPNACFDTKRTMASGAVDIGPCQHNLPAALSFPHFYLADPSYSDKVEGMKPDPDRHSFTLDMEPRLGLSLKINARIQTNFILERDPLIRNLRNIPELTYPILWQDLAVELDQKFADHLKSLMDRPLYYSLLFSYLLLGFGAIMVLAVAAFVAGRALQRFLSPGDDDSSLLINDDDKVDELSDKENGIIHG